MLRGFGLGGKKSETAAAADAAPAAGTAAGTCGSDIPTKILLVIDAGKEKWADIFDNAVVRLPTSRSRPAAAAGAGCGARSTGTTAGAGAGSGSGSGSQRSSSATDAAFAERTYRVEVVQTAWDKMNLVGAGACSEGVLASGNTCNECRPPTLLGARSSTWRLCSTLESVRVRSGHRMLVCWCWCWAMGM